MSSKEVNYTDTPQSSSTKKTPNAKENDSTLLPDDLVFADISDGALQQSESELDIAIALMDLESESPAPTIITPHSADNDLQASNSDPNELSPFSSRLRGMRHMR